jgi:protein-tyrosine kinase
VASRSAGPLIGGMGPAPMDAHLICDLSAMHDHFYKVLWKLLRRLDRTSGPALAGDGSTLRGSGVESPKKGGRALAFAGCEKGAGASTMAFNFASAFSARSSRKVVLVDGNVRNPGLLHMSRAGRPGLCDVILERAVLDDAIIQVVPERYWFVQAGRAVENPIALYESDAFVKLLEKLRSAYDLLIFDSPPLIDSPEAAVLASKVDGLVMVLQAEKTRWEGARAIQEELKAIDVPLLGAILNKRREVVPEFIRKRLWPYCTPFWQG